MSTFNVKLVVSQKHVTLALTEGTIGKKGSWHRDKGNSTSALAEDVGTWERSVLGPGGAWDLRLYDGSNTMAMVLQNFQAGIDDGKAVVSLEGFGGALGDEGITWHRS